jgi:hypothetical protein
MTTMNSTERLLAEAKMISELPPDQRITALELVRVQNKSEPLDLASGRFLNESALRAHALACSAKFKGGRFTRVGQDFLDEVSADVEAIIRDLRSKQSTKLFEPLEPDENTSCVTGALSAKVAIELNRLICRLIQNKVQSQPSCGKTLSRTR